MNGLSLQCFSFSLLLHQRSSTHADFQLSFRNEQLLQVNFIKVNTKNLTFVWFALCNQKISNDKMIYSSTVFVQMKCIGSCFRYNWMQSLWIWLLTAHKLPASWSAPTNKLIETHKTTTWSFDSRFSHFSWVFD